MDVGSTISPVCEASRGSEKECIVAPSADSAFRARGHVVTHVFSSTYDVVSTSERKLRGGDGWMEIRLTADGRGVVSAFDS